MNKMSGEVNDASAKSIGQMVGAGAIVTGSLTNIGTLYRLTLKGIDVQKAVVAVSFPADIFDDERVQALLRQSAVTAAPPSPAPQNTAVQTPAKPAVPAPAAVSAPVPAAQPEAPVGGGNTALTTITQISAYLATVTGRASSPAPLKVAIPLGAMTNVGQGWHTLLTALNDARKFVALDLSACTMDSKVFDPRVGINGEEMNAGASFIVEIILPNAATSTAVSKSGSRSSGNTDNITFKYFSNLRKAEGAVTDIGDYSFAGLTKLTTVSFPKAVSIGKYAFFECGGLTAVSFPSTMSIGEFVFENCSALTTVSFPACMTIGTAAFQNCGGLTTASFPEADNIGQCAFFSCNRLTSVTLGTITPPNFDNSSSGAFPGNLRDAYYQQPEGQRAGSYTRAEGNKNWSKR